MAYDKTNDLNDIQADVLTTDTTDNSKISKLKQLKTETKVPTKAINATYEQLGNAQASAADAVERTVALEETMTTVRADIDQVAQRVTRMETNGTGGAGGVSFTVNNDWMRTQVKDVRSWQSMSTPTKTAAAVNNLPGYDFSDDVRKFLPNTINNVTFTNTDDEESVKIYWNIDDLSAGDHVYTADYGLGYYSSTKAPTYGLHVYKQIEQYEYETNPNAKIDENGYYEIPLNSVVANYIPQKIKNISFTNAESEEYVNLVWPDIKTDQVIQQTYTANVPTGYCVKNKPFVKISFINPDDSEQIVGFISVTGEETGRSYPTFKRLDQNGESINFSSQHPIYSNIKKVTLSTGDFVEIPVVYVKNEVLTNGPYAGKICYYISNKESEGFHAHPAFLDKNGNSCPLQIAEYPMSLNDENLPCSINLGECKYNDTMYFHDDNYENLFNVVNQLNVNGEVGYSIYSVYTNDLLARLYAIEKSSDDITAQDDDKFYLYRNIKFPEYNTLIYGLIVENYNIHLLQNNGTNVMIDTGVNIKYDRNQYYPKCFLTNNNDQFDFNDLFITNGDCMASNRNNAFVDAYHYLIDQSSVYYFKTSFGHTAMDGLFGKSASVATNIKNCIIRLIRHKQQ